MKFIVSSLAAVATLGIAQAAMAQQAAGSEAEYCRMLARTYLSQNPVQSTPSVAESRTVERPRLGDGGVTSR